MIEKSKQTNVFLFFIFLVLYCLSHTSTLGIMVKYMGGAAEQKQQYYPVTV